MKYRRLSSATALMLYAVALLTSCRRTAAPSETAVKAALTVEVVSPVTSQWPELIEVSGSIAPWQESIVGAEASDLRLDEVLVNVGDVVTRGQLLARFNADTPAADLAVAEAAVVQAEAAAARASDRAARARRLGNAGGLSQDDLLQYEADNKSSAAQLASARAQLQLQRLRLRHTEVRAPDDGVISAQTATVGAVAGPGAELFRLILRQRLEWRALVPADQITRIFPGQLVTLRPAGQSTLTGVVRQISPVVDSRTLNGMVLVDLPAPGGLRAGMFVSGDLLFPVTPALHLPESALVFRDGFHYAMKVDASNRVRQIKVSTGRRFGQSVEIAGKNLTESDHIVRSGGSFLNEGDTVEVVKMKSINVDGTALTDAGGGGR